MKVQTKLIVILLNFNLIKLPLSLLIHTHTHKHVAQDSSIKNKQPTILAVFRCFKANKISGQHCTALYTNIFNEPRHETLPLMRKIHYSLFTNREY